MWSNDKRHFDRTQELLLHSWQCVNFLKVGLVFCSLWRQEEMRQQILLSKIFWKMRWRRILPSTTWQRRLCRYKKSRLWLWRCGKDDHWYFHLYFCRLTQINATWIKLAFLRWAMARVLREKERGPLVVMLAHPKKPQFLCWCLFHALLLVWQPINL